jgi:hypothetical protein
LGSITPQWQRQAELDHAVDALRPRAHGVGENLFRSREALIG